MPPEKLAIERRDLLGKRHYLADQGFQRGVRAGWQAILVRKRLLSQLCQIGNPGIGDETELRQMRSQSICQHGALANEQRPSAVSGPFRRPWRCSSDERGARQT